MPLRSHIHHRSRIYAIGDFIFILSFHFHFTIIDAIVYACMTQQIIRDNPLGHYDRLMTM